MIRLELSTVEEFNLYIEGYLMNKEKDYLREYIGKNEKMHSVKEAYN